MRLSRMAWIAVLASHLGLMAGLIAWCGWRTGALLVLPLIFPLPGLLRQRTYTAAWASLILVFYVAGLLAETYGLHLRHSVGGLLTLLAMFEFVSLLMFVRWAARERQAATAQTAA